MKKMGKLIFAASLIMNVIAVIYLWPSIKQKLGASEVTTPKNDYWMGRDQYFELLPTDSAAVIFLGTSITHNFLPNEAFSNVHIQNRGINGDHIKGMQKRLDFLLNQQPAKLFIEAGINDLAAEEMTPDEIIHAMNTLLETCKSASPTTKCYLLSVLPVANSNPIMKDYCKPEMNTKIDLVNAGYEEIAANNGVQYIALHDSFLTAHEINTELYAPDGVHLSGKGYELFRSLLAPYVNP